MKKLLVLFLVLITAPMAGALTVSLSQDGVNPMGNTINVMVGQVLNLSVISDTGDVDGTYYLLLKMPRTSLTAPATMTNVAVTANAGDLGSVDDYTTSAMYKVSLFVGGSTILPAAGKQFTFDLTVDGAVGNQFDFWITAPNDDNAPPYYTVTATIVPEPITIALLGLGGLFLRRRK